MAKKSKIAKLKHQEALVEKYAAKRAELKAAGDYIGLSKLPRNSAPVRACITVTAWMAVRMPICVNSACHG